MLAAEGRARAGARRFFSFQKNCFFKKEEEEKGAQIRPPGPTGLGPPARRCGRDGDAMESYGSDVLFGMDDMLVVWVGHSAKLPRFCARFFF